MSVNPRAGHDDSSIVPPTPATPTLVVCKRDDIVAIADVIRKKTGSSKAMTLSEMADAAQKIDVKTDPAPDVSTGGSDY